MKTQDILTVGVLGALAFFGYKAFAKPTAPPVPPPPPGSNPYEPGSNKAQNWLMWFTALVSSGLSITEAILQARQKTDAGQTPPSNGGGGGVGCATCNLPYSIGCSAGCSCQTLQPGELPTVL